MKLERVRKLNREEMKTGAILYWMSRDQRVKDNWCLVFAQELSQKFKSPIIVVFCLMSEFLNASNYIYDFMIDGLKEVEESLQNLNISFNLELGNPSKIIPQFVKKHGIGTLITDFSPLKLKRLWIKEIQNELKIPFYEVDTHNIIPCWTASEKQEYAAYTLRPKIKKMLDEYLDDFPSLESNPFTDKESKENINWVEIRRRLKINQKFSYNPQIIPGEKAALTVLNKFIKEKLKNYNRDRNNPNLDSTSNLSPYLHFDQISSQRIVLEAKKIKPISTLKSTFYDEIIVRKELSDNFCYYNLYYDNFQGFPIWAQHTIDNHRDDSREYNYTLEQFEHAETHDDLWNAAQMQMVRMGKMHGYLRMYWCKKIFEWTENPEIAMNIAILLNDKYELDGRDPNGYVGIAWSIGGVHDRAWGERKIFGKIRYMSYNSIKKKFNVNEFINKYLKHI